MRKILVFLVVAIVLSGCALNKSVYIPYNDKGHKDAAYEWAPHDDGVEWWYLTGYAPDQNNKLYFYQFTIFHVYKARLLEAYALHLTFTDCSTGQHVFSESIKFSSDEVYADSQCAVFKDSKICLDNKQIKIVGTSDKLKMDIEGTSTKDATWHGKDGIIVM